MAKMAFSFEKAADQRRPLAEARGSSLDHGFTLLHTRLYVSQGMCHFTVFIRWQKNQGVTLNSIIFSPDVYGFVIMPLSFETR
jgi:hypothetical protein